MDPRRACVRPPSSPARPTFRSYARRLGRAPREQLGEVIPELDLHTRLGHDVILLDDGQRVVPGPVNDQAGWEGPEHEREDHWHPGEHRLLNRIGRLGVHLHLEKHRYAHDQRPDSKMEEMAESWQRGRVPWDEPEEGEH